MNTIVSIVPSFLVEEFQDVINLLFLLILQEQSSTKHLRTPSYAQGNPYSNFVLANKKKKPPKNTDRQEEDIVRKSRLEINLEQ